MLKTFSIKHGRDFSTELAKARQVAEFAICTHSRTSKDVKHIGLPSAIANQVLRKYGRNRTIKVVRHVQLTVPGQGVRYEQEKKELYISCLKLRLDVSHLPDFEKVNQVEVDKEYAHVTVTVNEPPPHTVERWIGIDLNSTGHIAVVGNPSIGKVQKYGKEAPHIHRKYSKMRRHLYLHGHPRVAKKKIKRKENNKIKDINHKISRAIVDEAAQQGCGIKMEKLSDIRTTAATSKSSRPSLHSWSFSQLQTMIEYKAKLLGLPVAFVDPAFTSQQCSRCGLLGTRNGKDFMCSCGHVDHADANASFNIALRPSLEESDGRSHQDRDWCKGRIDAPQEATS
ncbi:MAG: transposase [Methanomassiliicoccus sp.]|nr:transposase [Methanomassiliicoccus sp.]